MSDEGYHTCLISMNEPILNICDYQSVWMLRVLSKHVDVSQAYEA